jgi:hypothetical protein
MSAKLVRVSHGVSFIHCLCCQRILMAWINQTSERLDTLLVMLVRLRAVLRVLGERREQGVHFADLADAFAFLTYDRSDALLAYELRYLPPELAADFRRVPFMCAPRRESNARRDARARAVGARASRLTCASLVSRSRAARAPQPGQAAREQGPPQPPRAPLHGPDQPGGRADRRGRRADGGLGEPQRYVRPRPAQHVRHARADLPIRAARLGLPTQRVCP